MRVKIISGKRGFHLKVDNLFIHQGLTGEIKAIICECGIPYGASEWVHVQAIRDFWTKRRREVVASTQKPYKSVWGNLVPA